MDPRIPSMSERTRPAAQATDHEVAPPLLEVRDLKVTFAGRVGLGAGILGRKATQSRAVDGVSLTVASLDEGAFEVMLIPHTLAVTTLGRLVAGQAVNIETDVIGKYVQRSLAVKGA